MQERYGWNPRVELGDGLRRTIQAFREAEAAATSGSLRSVVEDATASNPDVVGAA
jgi:hypothetical protein